MTLLIGLCEVIALDAVIFAVLFATIEIFFYVRKMITLSDNKELILFRVFVGMAAFLGLLFLACTIKP